MPAQTAAAASTGNGNQIQHDSAPPNDTQPSEHDVHAEAPEDDEKVLNSHGVHANPSVTPPLPFSSFRANLAAAFDRDSGALAGSAYRPAGQISHEVCPRAPSFDEWPAGQNVQRSVPISAAVVYEPTGQHVFGNMSGAGSHCELLRAAGSNGTDSRPDGSSMRLEGGDHLEASPVDSFTA